MPRVQRLEARELLATLPVFQPMFQVGALILDSSPPSGAYTPAQIQQAYQYHQVSFNGKAGDGSGETIAIVDAYDDPDIQADLKSFDGQFNLPAITITKVNQNGGSSLPGTDPSGGWELEESLDVEWAHAMAPGANILLVEADSDNGSDLLTAVSYAAHHANVVSMSWGGSEFSTEASSDSDFVQAGVAFVASSGDNGAPASWPAASPNVLAVGGTVLTLSGSTWSSETGWSGSGGGPSAYESQPSYQSGVVTTTTMRANPDVAYDASPDNGFAVYDSYQYYGTSYGWLQVGGTSAGAPQWAAILAIADQGRSLGGQPAIDSSSAQEVMTTLYKNPGDFHDITTGNSTGSPQYTAGPGYDYVTGLGTPMVNLVINSFDSTSAPGASATFLEQDATTQGTWMGTYGSQGYDVIDGSSSLPNYATITPSGESNYIWASSTTDPRALQTSGGSSRIAATWFSKTSFTVDVDLTDGQAHDLELYFLDWDKLGRSEQVQISNASTGAVLSTQSLSSFQSGVYLDYAVSGNILITITNQGGKNAVLGGLFLDPGPSSTRGSFVEQDIATQGNGVGAQSSKGHDIEGDPESLPSGARVGLPGDSTATWASSTSDVRELLNPGGSGRAATTRYSSSSIAINVNPTGGQVHDLALYAVAWDSTSPDELIQTLGAATETALSTRKVAAFPSGVYLDDAVSRNIRIAITAEAGTSNVLNGRFLDPES